MNDHTHPQPAFNLLMTLVPNDKQPYESIFSDWYAYPDIGADNESNIRHYPKLWEQQRIPEAVDQVDEDSLLGVLQHDDKLNLNALAIGMGLEDITYEPEEMFGLVYNLDTPDMTVIIFSTTILLIPADGSRDTVKAGIENVTERIEALGLGESFPNPVENAWIGTVSERLEQHGGFDD